jgi:alkanesulfonate monooxygenase SsuD/methylene tetrahydromethanopterin reductase-like flavin-dependent oxidoreductase (luciferase family)
VAAALPVATISEVARAAEAAGYRTFWVNDTPGADGLERLAAAAAVTSRIGLGVGVIPLDRRPAETIVARLRELPLPLERLILGIGSGGAAGGLARVRAGLAVLREARVPVLVGALGPRMCRLSGEAADGPLLNWVTVDYARQSIAWATEAARAAGRPAPRCLAYVRVALPEGAARLESEAARYTAIPHYGAHFVRMGVPAATTGVAGEPAVIQATLAGFEPVVEEAVARALTPTDSLDEILALLRAAAPSA